MFLGGFSSPWVLHDKNMHFFQLFNCPSKSGLSSDNSFLSLSNSGHLPKFEDQIKEKTFTVNLSDFAEHDLWTPSFSCPLYKNIVKVIKNKWKTVSLDEIAIVESGKEAGSDNYIKYLDKKMGMFHSSELLT